MKKIIPVFVLISALACLTPSALQVVFPAHEPAPVPPVTVMVVTGDLNVRTGAGETFPLVDKKLVLHAGDVVVCRQFEVKGDSIWCKHEWGWSNARWLNGIIGSKEK